MDYKRALKDGLSPETIMQEMERRGAKLDYKRALADGVSPDNIMSEMFSRLPPAKSPLIANPNASWLGTNLAKSLETGREVVGGLQRFAGDEQGGLSTIAKSKANMEQLETDVPSMSTKDVTGVGSGLKYIGENVVKNAALAIPSMVGGAVAALAAPVVGGGALAAGGLAALGALVPSVAIETGIISADSHKVDGNRGRILKGALPAGALDAVSTAVTLGAGGLLKKPLQKTAVDLLKNETGKQIAVRYAKGAAGLVGAGLEEGATEGAQSPLEKWGAGKQVFKDGKTYEMDLLGNTVAALSGGYLGSKDNYTPEMQDEIKESAWGGAAAGFGMAGGGKAISVGKEKINEFMKRREERIFLEELENGSLSSSENAAPEMTRNTEIGIIAVEEAKQKKAEDDAKEADQMHQENMQQLAAQVPVIKTMTENPDTPVTSEHRAIVEQVAQGMPGTKEGDAAAKLLSKIDKSMEKDSEANHSELHKQLDDMKYDAKHGLLGDEHLSTVLGIYKNNQDGKARDKAKIIIDTHLQAEEKRNKEIEKKREELKGNAVDAISNVRSELKSDAHNQAAMVAMDSKIATAKAALDAVETSGTKEKPFTPQQRQAAEGKKATLKAKLEALKKEKMLLSQEHAQSSSETDIAHAEARQALVEAQGHTAENVGQSVEHAKSYIEQLVFAGKAAWKNFKEFSSHIEGIYGKYIKPHLFALWQHAKNALKAAGNKIVETHQEKKNTLQKPARKGLFGALFSNKGQVIIHNQDGTTKTVPFNQEQKAAIEAVAKFIESGNKNTFYTVMGKAGTGKTTIAQAFVKELKDKANVVIAAVSHQAKKVIHKKFKDKKIRHEAYSLAKLLGMKFNENTGEFTPDTSKRRKPAPIESADIIIIDECSMIDERALELIMSKKRRGASVIFLGDSGQLPPIRKQIPGQPVNNSDSPTFGNKQMSKLLKRERTGEDAPILPYADIFWDNAHTPKPEFSPDKENQPVNSKNGRLAFVNSFGSIKKYAVDLFRQAIESKNPNLVKIIVSTNNKSQYGSDGRNEYNKKIHDELYLGIDGFGDGEPIIFNDNYYNEERGIEITNSSSGFAEVAGEVTWRVDKYGIRYADITVNLGEDDGTHTVVCYHPEDEKKFKNKSSELYNYAKSLPDYTPAKDNAMHEWSALRNGYAQIDYAYAITVHKSQGSEYDTVIVDKNSINNMKDIKNNSKFKSQSIYTSLTRVKKDAIVITSGEILPVIDMDASVKKYSKEDTWAEDLANKVTELTGKPHTEATDEEVAQASRSLQEVTAEGNKVIDVPGSPVSFGTGLAQVSKDGVIQINIDKARDTFENPKNQEQIDVLNSRRPGIAKKYEKLGFTAKQFMSVFKNFDEFRQYLIRHEQSHINNKDNNDPVRSNIWKEITAKYDMAKEYDKAVSELKAHPRSVDIEVRATLEGLTEQQRQALKEMAAVQETQASTKNEKMSYAMSPKQNIYGENTTTLALSEDGRRTGSTRSFKMGNGVGSVMTFEGRPTQYKVIGYEQITPEKAANPEWVRAWSKKEGWTPEHFYTQYNKSSTVRDGAWQTSWTKIGQTNTEQPSQATKTETPIATPQNKIDNINKILDSYNWPKELRDAITVVHSTKSTLPLFTDMSAKSHLAKFGITGMAVNWILKNQAKVKLGSIKSEQQVRELAEKQLAEKQDKSKYPSLKETKAIKKNFDEWTEALKQYDTYFADMMFDYTIKLIEDDRREDVGVPKVNKAILAEVYDFAVNNPGQTGYSKEYERRIIAAAIEASSHEKSASGKGVWIHIPHSPAVDFVDGNGHPTLDRNTGDWVKAPDNDQRKANIKLLECLSPTGWCTAEEGRAGYNAPNSVGNYDNYILVDSNKIRVVTGLQVRPDKELYDATSIANNEIASIDWLDDTIAFMDKHDIDYVDEPTIRRAIEYKKRGKTDADTAHLRRGYDDENNYNDYEDIDDERGAYDWTAYDNQWDDDFELAFTGDIPFSKRTTGNIEGWATGDSAVVNAAVVDPKDAGKVALHEVAHLGMIRLAQDLGGMKELHKILKSAKTELMKAVPELLKRTGHTSLAEFAIDYGYDANTEAGEAKILVELTARWAEKFESVPHASWWTKLINSITMWYKKYAGKELTKKEVDVLVAEMIRYGATDNKAERNNQIVKSEFNSNDEISKTAKLINAFDKWYEEKPSSEYRLADASVDSATNKLVFTRWISAIVTEIVDPNESLTATAISTKWRPIDWLANPGNMSYFGEHQVVPRLNALLPGFSEWVKGFKPLDNSWVDGLLDTVGKDEEYNKAQKDKQSATLAVITALETVRRRIPELSESDMPILMTDALYNILAKKLGISQENKEPEQPQKEKTQEREYTPDNITSLAPNEVFVFGANTVGGHGGGAAGLAQFGDTKSNYDAPPIGTKGKWSEYGVVDRLMEGTEGKSFGLVTKSAAIVKGKLYIHGKRSVDFARISKSLDALVKVANEHPELKFLVTEFGTRMAGFTAEEMKSILASKVLPDNVILPKSFETRPDVIVVEDAKEAVKESVVKDEKDYSAPIASEFVNHSGGAKGSDAFWDRTGKVFGVTDHRHYREESAEKLGDKFLNDEGVEPVRIKEDSTEWEVATRKAMLATLALRPTTRIDDKTKRMVIIEGESAFAPEDLQIRNWFQVKNAEAVFAIGRIVEPADMSSFAAYSKAGDKQRSTKANKKGERYINNSGKQIVDGGTGYAVEMAIQKGDIPVYVFDQTRGSWFKWDALKNEFTKTDTPTLTKNFAGIGTRELTPEGMKAIRDVYAKTFSTENNRRADRLIEDVSTEMANSEERIKEIERKKEEAKKEAEGLAPLEAFFVYVGKGVYQEWFNNRVAWIGMIEAEKERQSILQQHVDSIKKDFPRYKIVGLKQDGLDTVEIEQDSPLYEYPGFERLMVGAHGVYAEFGEASRPFIAKESITNPVKQSDSRQYITYYSNGSRVYDQRKMVNYAQYEIGKLYVSADVVEGLSTRNEVAAPIIAKAHAERSGINSWNEQGVTSISRETIQQLNDVYELFSDLSKKEMIDWLKNQLENRLDIELNGVAEKVLMTDENGNSLVVSKTIKPARTTSPTGSMGLRRFDSESEEQHRTVVAYNSATALGKPTNNFVFSTKNGSSTVAMVAPGDGELEIWSYVEGFFEDTYTTKIASKSPSAARELKATATSVDKDPYKYIGSTDSIAAFAYKASYPNGVGLSKEERDAHRFETTRKIQEGLERKNEELLKSIEKDINSNPVLNGSSPESIITYTSPSDPDERRAYFTNNKVSTIVVGLLRDVMNRGYDLKSFYKSMFYEEASKSFASTKEIPVMLVAFHSYINRDRASNAEYDGPYNEQNDAHKTISQEAEHLVSVAPAEEHTKRQGLNKEQQEAVDYSGGPQLIVAGAGTGKTTVITERIKSLVNKGIPPEEILAITFARDARKEMKDRLEGTNAESANVSTFHAFGKGILDEYYKEFGYRSKPAVLSELQSTQIVESIMKELGIADMTPDEALAAIDKLKNDGVTPGKYAKQKDKSASISNIYTEYAEKTKNSIDLNDMILGMKQHLLNNPAILNDVQNSIRSMLVDEYQDTNKAQYELMSLLAPHDLTVVGDDNQSLYSWRGADVGALKNFMSDFNPKVTQLVENYRTTGTILEAAQDVISKNEDRISTNLTPSREEGNPIIYREVANEKDEAFFIAKEIKDAISRGAAPGSIAILTRTNAQHAIINRELASRKIFGIHVQTFNGAKGREFSTVFIAGVSEGLTPHVKAGDTLEEERRLLYVGMTRAKDNLIMTHANETSQGGKTAEKEPSRFLADIKPGRWDEKSTQMVDVKKEKFSDLTAEEWEYGYAEDIKAADRHEAFQGASRKMTDADRVDTFESEFGVQRAQHEFDSGHDGNLVRDQYKRDNKEVAGFYEYYDGAKEKRKQKEAAFNVRQLQSLQEMVAFNRTSAEFIAPLFDALDVLIDQVPTNKKHTDLSPAEKKERKKLTSSRLKDALKIVVDKSEDLVALKEAYSAAIESGKIDAIVANFMRALTHFNGKQVLAHQGILNQNYQGLENESIPFMQFGTAEFSEALKELTPLGEQISANPVLYTGLDLDETYRDTVQLVNIQKAAADPLEIAQGFAPDLDSELQAWKRPASMQDIHNSVVESVGNNVSPSLRQAIRVYRTRSAAIAIYDERLANVDGLMKLLSFLSSAEIDKAKYENKIANPEFKTYATEEQRTAWMASMKEGLAYINDTIDKIKAKIPKGTSLESLRKTKDRIQRDTVAMQSLARPVLMRIAFEQSHVMDASLFTKIAGDFNKVHPDSKLTAADVFNKYLAVGADIVRLHSEMNRLSRDFWDKQIAKAYGIGKVSRQVKAREVLLARLTTEEKDLLAQMGSHKGDAVDVLKNLSAPVRNKMIAIFNAEIALKNIDVKASMRELDKDKKASMENVKKQEAEPSIQQKIDALNNQIIELKKQEQGLWDIVSRRAYVGKGINRYKAEWKTNSAYIMMSRLFSPSELSVFYPGVEPQDYLDNSANRISRSVDSPILEESNIRGKKPLQKVTNIEIHNPSSQKTILAKHLTIRPSLQQQQEIQQAEQRLLELRKMQSALEQDITNLENADIADVLGSVTTPQQIRSLEDVAQEKAPEHYTQEEADVVSRYKGANLKAVSLKGVAKFFFEKIANIFGANLVTVKGDSDWHGKYIPNRGKGKPTIVINVNAPSLTAVFAHEMFHHILNKISPAAYDAFREAMRGAVNENKWEEAVIRIARQMDSSYVKTVLDDVILTDSINTSPLYGSNFNDDPLVRKKKASFWKPKEPPIAKDKKFAAFQRHDKLNVSDEIREEIENELYSEIFSQAIHKGAFWSTLGKTLEGRGVVAYCVSHMANRSASILSLLKQISPETQNSYLVSQLVKNWSDPASFNTDAKEGRSIHDILVGVIDNSLFVDKKGNVTAKTIVNGMELGLRDDVTRDRKINLLNEAKLLSGEIKKKTNVLAKEARKIIPQGTNGYVQVMDAIENWINRILDWLAAHKPAGMFADFRTREEIVALAQKVLHGGNAASSITYYKILKKHKEAFSGMTDDELMDLHDKASRYAKDVTALDSLKPEQKAAFLDMLAESEKLYDEIAAEGILPPRFTEDGKPNPLAQYRNMHMGQTIKWRHKDGRVIDESISKILKPDKSQLKRDEGFLETKSDVSTKELHEKYDYEKINPLEMFRQYVEDVHHMIAVSKMIKEGREKGLIKRFESRQKAAYNKNNDGTANPYVSINDDTARILKEIPGGDITEIQMFTEIYAVRYVTNKNKKKGKWLTDKKAMLQFDTQEEAAEALAKLSPTAEIKYVSKDVMKPVPTHLADDLYFDKDLAHLLDTILSRDNFRQGQLFGVSGEKIMDIKNTLTMLELSMSAFHWATISAETVSSYGEYKMQLARLNGKSMVAASLNSVNVMEAFNSSRELQELTEKIIVDNNYKNTEEGKALLERLLGASDVDIVDAYMRFFDNGGAMDHQDIGLRSGVSAWGDTEKSFAENVELMQANYPNSALAPIGKVAIHQLFVKSSALLMEKMIPRVKFAAFIREYIIKLMQFEKNNGRKATEAEKSEIARHVMKFVEDRFGEVNWKNQWLNKTYKTTLQFLFRSFTWVAGSWKALGKAGIDYAKLGWFTVKDMGQAEGHKRQYQLTEHGLWGMSAMIAHVASVAAVYSLYFASSALCGGGQDDDEDTPWITKLLFPRIDPYDNTKRLTIPSYVSEGYKILSHFGMFGSKVELEKLVTGRMNSMIGKSVELIKGEDFRGVQIINPDDNMLEKSWSMTKHVLATGVPMSLTGMKKIYNEEGMSSRMLFNLAGMQDAPASAKRSVAANAAFDLSRREYKGKEITEDEMEMKSVLKRAMQEYVKGDKTSVDALLASGEVSKRQYDIALTRYPVLNNAPNPLYKDPLSQAIQRLTVKSSLKVYSLMKESEKAKHTAEIQKKINNMKLRKDTPKVLQDRYIEEWNAIKG